MKHQPLKHFHTSLFSDTGVVISTVMRALLRITTSYFSNEESDLGVNIHS